MNQTEFNFDTPPKKSAAEISVELLEKIKKLLRLSESSNPNEAALAMARAMELADRHNLDLSTLDTDEDVAQIIHRWFPLGNRISSEMRLAVGIVRRYFNVATCFERDALGVSLARVIFVGTDSDIVVADYVAHFLVETCRRCAKAYESAEKKDRRKMTANKRASFRAGFFYGITEQLEAGRQALFMEDKKFALILRDQAEARQDVLQELVGPMMAAPHRKYRRVLSAVMQGYEDGKNTSINPGLTAAGKPAALPLQDR